MPGHENHIGNIIAAADEMVKAGINMITEGQEPQIPMNKCIPNKIKTKRVEKRRT